MLDQKFDAWKLPIPWKYTVTISKLLNIEGTRGDVSLLQDQINGSKNFY